VANFFLGAREDILDVSSTRLAVMTIDVPGDESLLINLSYSTDQSAHLSMRDHSSAVVSVLDSDHDVHMRSPPLSPPVPSLGHGSDSLSLIDGEVESSEDDWSDSTEVLASVSHVNLHARNLKLL
jgi:hypothetical protein